MYFNMEEKSLMECALDMKEHNTIFNTNHNDVGNENVFAVLNSRKYQINLIVTESDEIFNQVRKYWRQLEDVILTIPATSLKEVIKYRKQIIYMVQMCIYNLKIRPETNHVFLKKGQLLRNTIFKISDLDKDMVVKLSATIIQNSQTQIYHYFHCYLDVQWLLLQAFYLCKSSDDCLKEYIQEIIKDLVTVSKKPFLQVNNTNELKIDPFICVCVKQLWLRLQIFTEKISNTKLFWECFNHVLKNEDCLFTLWLVYHIAILHGYDEQGAYIGKDCYRVQENHLLIDSSLKILFQNEDNIKLFSCLHLIQPLLNEWWITTVNLETYKNIWDYFYGKLIDGTENVLPTTAAGIISDSENCNSRPYMFFLYMLLNHFKHHPQQWAKLRGRMYSRISVKSVNLLNDHGVYNVALLFILLTRVDFEEATCKLQRMCENLPEHRQNTKFVWNIYIALVILYIKENKCIEGAVAPLLKLVENAAKDRDQFHLVELFIEGFSYILSLSSNFKLGQKQFLGKWISDYMHYCSLSDLGNLSNILFNLANKLSTDDWIEWDYAFRTYVLTALKQVANLSSTSSQLIGDLAAVISLQSQQIFSEAVSYFTSENVVPIISSAYMCNILKNYPASCVLTTSQINSMVEAWVRCCILTNENHIKLTKNICKLNAFNLPIEWFDDDDDPLCYFIEKLSVETSTTQLRETCDLCFGNIDKMISRYISNPTNGGIILRIYTCCACLIYYCASFLYDKTKSSCTLSRLIMLLLLPTEFLMGREPHSLIKSAIQCSLHLFIKGLCKLNWKNDAFLERTLRDLIVRYVPYFSDSASPLLKCFDDSTITDVVLDKITAAYLTVPRPPNCSEENSNKALNILNIYIQTTTSVQNIQCIIRKIINGILEFIIFHSNRQNAIEIIRFLAASEFYVSIRNIIRQGIIHVTEKHMAFKTNSYFQFISILIKLIPLDVQAVLPNIKQQVTEVEKMRGVGFDNVLQQGLSRIETALLCE